MSDEQFPGTISLKDQGVNKETQLKPEDEIIKSHETIEKSILTLRDTVMRSVKEDGSQLDQTGWRAYAYDSSEVSKEQVTDLASPEILEPVMEIEFYPVRQITGLAKTSFPDSGGDEVKEHGFSKKEPESCTVVVLSGGSLVKINLDLYPMGERNIEWSVLHIQPAGMYDVIPLESPEVKSSSQNKEVVVSNVKPKDAEEAINLASADLAFATETIEKMSEPGKLHYRIFSNTDRRDSQQQPRFILANKTE